MNPADRPRRMRPMSEYEKALDALALDASTDAVAMAHALLAVADAIAAHNRPTPTVESPATGVPDTPPAPVGVGSVLDGNPTVVAAILDTLPKGAVVIDLDGVVHQRRHAGWWRTVEGPVRSSDSRSVAYHAPLTVLWLPKAGESDE